jgi:hypothetical protein
LGAATGEPGDVRVGGVRDWVDRLQGWSGGVEGGSLGGVEG